MKQDHVPCLVHAVWVNAMIRLWERTVDAVTDRVNWPSSLTISPDIEPVCGKMVNARRDNLTDEIVWPHILTQTGSIPGDSGSENKHNGIGYLRHLLFAIYSTVQCKVAILGRHRFTIALELGRGTAIWQTVIWGSKMFKKNVDSLLSLILRCDPWTQDTTRSAGHKSCGLHFADRNREIIPDFF